MKITDLLRQAQDMQGKFASMQEELAQKKVQGTSGGGIVTVTANGHQEILSIQIDPEFFKGGDLDMLQDLIVAAVNDALSQTKNLMEQEMQNLAGGFNLPGFLRGAR